MPEQDQLKETREALLSAIDAFVEVRQFHDGEDNLPFITLSPPEFIDVLQVLVEASENAGFGTPEGERIWSVVRLLLHKLKKSVLAEPE